MSDQQKRRVHKQDLAGERFEQEACLLTTVGGELYLTHLEAFTEDGRRLLFSGLIKLPLSKFRWIEQEGQE